MASAQFAARSMIEQLKSFIPASEKKFAGNGSAKFLQDQQFDLLISTGFAGALNDQLQVGDLLLAKNFSTIELNKKRSSFSRLPIHEADLLTVAALIDSSDERPEIARTSGAAAVDMETEFIARACAEHGIPLLSLRVITDTPRRTVPCSGARSVRHRQTTNRSPEVGGILSCASESHSAPDSVREEDCECAKDSGERACRDCARAVALPARHLVAGCAVLSASVPDVAILCPPLRTADITAHHWRGEATRIASRSNGRCHASRDHRPEGRC